MRKVSFEQLGLIDYARAWEYQEQLFNSLVKTKFENRSREGDPVINPNYLLFCQHPHVYTLGKSGHSEYLLINEAELELMGAAFHKINRGGDITYHGPGQIVGYPIFDLEQFFTDIHRYLRTLEEAVILTLREYGISSGRIAEYTGVWIDPENPSKARKICAFGVKCSRWITMHGFALNVNPDLSYFQNIIPCGIKDKDVTSMQQELGHIVDIDEVQDRLKVNLSNVFDFDFFTP